MPHGEQTQPKRGGAAQVERGQVENPFATSLLQALFPGGEPSGPPRGGSGFSRTSFSPSRGGGAQVARGADSPQEPTSAEITEVITKLQQALAGPLEGFFGLANQPVPETFASPTTQGVGQTEPGTPPTVPGLPGATSLSPEGEEAFELSRRQAELQSRENALDRAEEARQFDITNAESVRQFNATHQEQIRQFDLTEKRRIDEFAKQFGLDERRLALDIAIQEGSERQARERQAQFQGLGQLAAALFPGLNLPGTLAETGIDPQTLAILASVSAARNRPPLLSGTLFG